MRLVLGLEHVEALVVVANVEIGPPLHGAFEGFKIHDGLEHGGFARAVGTDDSDALAATDFGGEIVPELFCRRSAYASLSAQLEDAIIAGALIWC